MTIRYLGLGGSDANSGLTWALRKLTLNGVEDTPVVAGDTVYVGPGTYRELLTVDVSGTAGNPISYIGDYGGTFTDGIGGIVRITGSNDDQSETRTSCITASVMNYRTFTGFVFDTTNGSLINTTGGCGNWTVSSCLFVGGNGHGIIVGGTASAWAIENCMFQSMVPTSYGVIFTNTSTVDNAAHVVSNCAFTPGFGRGVGSVRVGGVTVKNCTLIGGAFHILVVTALTAGQTITVNNCILCYSNVALQGTATTEIIEDFNTFYRNATNRTNTNTGANSVTYPALFDPRWLFDLVGGQGRMLSPFDLASFSQLVNLAGTSPTTTDLRGTAVIGAEREWGALEYDPALLFRRVIARQV